jgi:arabinogalactan endo-1,4-beta-galactosidase
MVNGNKLNIFWKNIMKQILRNSLLVMISFWIVSCGSNDSDTDKVHIKITTPPKYHESGLYVQPIDNINENFIKGADISTLIEVEKHGGTFYDENGNEIDAMKALADHGVNWIRIRIWNNPYDVSWVKDVTGYDIVGAVGGGTNDLNKALALAKRAKNLNLKVLLDFHYSDFWAHPGQQYIPDAWRGLSEDQVEQALYDFTYDTLMEMNAEGVFPDMVQIGNEINSGLVSPQGDNLSSEGAINLLRQGISAVRAAEVAASASAEVMIHLAEGGNNELFTWAFDAFTEAGLDYDIIGVSYYPYWHGSLADLQYNLESISTKYNKEVIVVETASAFTLEEGPDGGNNIFSEKEVATGGFKATVQGQATAMREIMNVTANVTNGLGRGIFYWEPTWLAVEGIGWATGKSNGWKNQTMFDYEGNTLDSMDVFWKVSATETVAQPTIVSVDGLIFELEQGADLVLPTQVRVLYSDDAYRNIDVNWHETGFTTDNVGTFTVLGSADNSVDMTAIINVVETAIISNDSAMKNYSFETGEITPWLIDNGNAGLALTETVSDIHAGKYGLHFWSANDMQQTITQTQTVDNGIYIITAWFMGGEASENASLIKASSGDSMVTDIAKFTGWGVWNKSTVNIEVTDGSLTISVVLNEAAGTWGNIDEVKAELVP